MKEIIHKELSYEVMGAVFKVHSYLGPGLLESAYESCLVIELRRRGLKVSQQHVFPIYYYGEAAAAYIADLVVEGTIILELKSVQILTSTMEAQLINYLRLSKLRVGYLINLFGKRVVYKRFVL